MSAAPQRRESSTTAAVLTGTDIAFESRIAPGAPSDARFGCQPETTKTKAILSEVMSEITVYSTDPCSFCARVKGMLKARGVEYSEVNLSKDPQGRVELANRTGMMTFPQVLIDGELLGGFAEVQAAVESGRLDELLAA